MGDDVPILGALVTLKGYGLLLFLMMLIYISMVRSSYIINLVWEMTSQFWVQWSHFLEVRGYCWFWWCFYTSIWNDHCFLLFGGNGHLVNMVIWWSGDLVIMVIWSASLLVNWSSCHLVIWSSGHLVNMVIWSSCHLVEMVIWWLW